MASDSKSRFLVAEGPGLSEFLEARISEYEAQVSDAQMLRIAEALRTVITEHGLAGPDCETCSAIAMPWPGSIRPVAARWPCRSLRAVAAIWSDHRDYQRKWGPR